MATLKKVKKQKIDFTLIGAWVRVEGLDGCEGKVEHIVPEMNCARIVFNVIGPTGNIRVMRQHCRLRDLERIET